MPSKSNNPSPDARNFLRRKFLPVANKVPSDFPRRFYIPREKTRSILNESELNPILRKNSIEIIRPESLSFIEQVALFSRAELIIAPHGAALANLIFAPPKSSVIEIFSPNYVNICYWVICNLGDIRYSYLLGDGKRPKPFHDPHHVRENIIAPIDKLDKWIHKWVDSNHIT
jgi:capsular polysaccharide biosynthesis protein